MSQALRYIINACDPMDAARPEFYVDTTAARGGGSFVSHYLKRLANADSPTTCELFSGHIGCGKSSELRKLQGILERKEHGDEYPRFFPIYLDAAEYLNFYDVTPNDVLLAIAAELGESLRAVGIELADNYLTKRVREIWGGLTTDLGIEKVEAGTSQSKNGLADLKFILKFLPKDESARQAVQKNLRPQSTRILDELNSVFDQALDKLRVHADRKKERAYEGIVVVVDSLDRIRRVNGVDTAEASWRELFIRNAELLRGIRAHLVYTVPLSLVRSIQDNLQGAYGQPAFVLPMVTAERRNGLAYESGRAILRELLQKRTNDLPLTGDNGVFTEDALEFLLRYCGGHPRQLLGLVVEAALNAPDLPIDIVAARKSVVPTVRQFSPSIPHAYYAKMAQVTRDPQRQIDNNDADYRNMLEQNWVLEYVNGGETDDPFATTAPWYAVHPIIRELPSYKAAFNEQSALNKP